MDNEGHGHKKIGLFGATCVVAGNMIGSGVFMLPASLAAVSGPGATLVAWLITGIGSIFMALSCARLGSRIPKTGGPYEFGKLAFGDFIGFLNAWLYWSATWISNAAIIIAIGSYASYLIPALNNGFNALLFNSAILWIFTFLNIKGAKEAASFETVITVFKFLVFIFFIIFAASHFNMGNVTPMMPKGKGLSTLPLAATTTLWAFTGFESSAVGAGTIKDPEKNISRSTILGLVITILFYIAISFFAMGAIPQDVLAKSPSPMTDILAQFFGGGVVKAFNLAIVITILGTIAGWIMIAGQMSYAVAKDGLFPAVFAKLHPKYKTPYKGLIINAILTNILLILNSSKGMVSAYNFMILLATLSYLPVYATTSASDILLLFKCRGQLTVGKFIKIAIIPLIGFTYACWAIYGSGAETVLYGFMLMLAGVPFYIYMKLKNKKDISKADIDIDNIVQYSNE
ncbi:APC family permease [Clostridium sporogenes]|uniref:APC family permease n=2 Tax=Clostridium TaxID=1485 RepID=UPI0006B29349|nr:amino acid permease [Clostridium sporogenes]KOY67692.1 amino acid permease [Clostridium sporogenes]NFT05263.1 amino acid permease [Clostridium sporogenes]NFT31144.1 amino acid permease [Clostridium sporogenes]NFT38411.1 amino acid permease [Clostridium sporogenes]NFT52449.1 amino acid permease [Clostridium sporogenes]